MSVSNWFDFSYDDIESAEILLKQGKYNMACFHSQQAAEKALKGFLVHNKVTSPRIHNLIELLNLCSNIDGKFQRFLPEMATLNQFYAPTRYPDAAIGSTPLGMPDKATAEKALEYAKEITDFCLDAIRQKAAEKEEKNEEHNESQQDKKNDIDWIKDIRRKIVENEKRPRNKMNEQDRGFDR